MRIAAIETYLPEKVVTNDDLQQRFPEWNGAKMGARIGIDSRHIAATDETAADMAVKAAEKLFIKCDKSSIDFVTMVTQTPDYFLPTTACLIQDRLGLRSDCGAFDMNLGCSGWVYGLAMGKSMIDVGMASKVLLLTGDTYSKLIRQDDIANLSLFGDAGTATLLESNGQNQVGSFVFGTNGKGAPHIMVSKGGMRNPVQADETPAFEMNGMEVYNFTMEYVPALIEKVLSKNNMTSDETDYYIMHQANGYILEFLRNLLQLPESKWHNDIRNYGNTTSSTIPIALKDVMDNNMLATGSKVLTAGFGVGYSWAGTVITM